MATTTEEAIRTAMLAAVEALSPTLLSGSRFLRHREERDFVEWAEAAPRGSLRRVSLRDRFDSRFPETTNTTEEWRVVTFDVVVAYPHSYNYGADEGRDRDDVITSDRMQLENAIGLRSAAIANATTMPRDYAFDVAGGAGVDFLRLVIPYGFYRSTP